MLFPVRTKRIYDGRAESDGLRILVDRLWPRGVTKADAAVDLCLINQAPITKLRRWLDHRAALWAEFRKRYCRELAGSPAVGDLRALTCKQSVTLVYAAKDREHNEAIVFAEFLGGEN
jgi:uncharacterized protein YeaO (DUF488 family)